MPAGGGVVDVSHHNFAPLMAQAARARQTNPLPTPCDVYLPCQKSPSPSTKIGQNVRKPFAGRSTCRSLTPKPSLSARAASPVSSLGKAALAKARRQGGEMLYRQLPAKAAGWIADGETLFAIRNYKG